MNAHAAAFLRWINNHREGICIWLAFGFILALTLWPPWRVIDMPSGTVLNYQPPLEHPRIDRFPIWLSTHAAAVVDYKKLLTEIALGESFVLALYLTWGRAQKQKP
jgi:hypothetical protein